MISLEGKTILITGASSGIGKATALLCAKLSARCVITGRDTERLDSVLQSLEGEGHQSIPTDFSEQDGIDVLVNGCSNLDGIVHCAGMIQLMPYRSISTKSFEKIMKLNLYAPFFI